MSGVGTHQRSRVTTWPRRARAGLFALSNAPAAVLLLWLACGWGTASPWPAAFALAAGLLGNLLLLALLARSEREAGAVAQTAAQKTEGPADAKEKVPAPSPRPATASRFGVHTGERGRPDLATRLAELAGKTDVRAGYGRGSAFRRDWLSGASPTPARAGRPVLVVLSGDGERQGLARQLTDSGLRATAVRTGKEALTELLHAVVAGDPFALVLIEEHLADLSAREVLNRLAGRSDAAPAAVVLGNSEGDLPLPDGVRAVLSRSATAAQVRQAVLRVLGSGVAVG